MAQVKVQPVCPAHTLGLPLRGLGRFPNGPKSNRGHRLGHHVHVRVHDSVCACHVCICLSTFVTQPLQVLLHSHALAALCPG